MTSKKQFFAYNSSGLHFYPTSCGVIRNQRRKIRRILSVKYENNDFRAIGVRFSTGAYAHLARRCPLGVLPKAKRSRRAHPPAPEGRLLPPQRGAPSRDFCTSASAHRLIGYAGLTSVRPILLIFLFLIQPVVRSFVSLTPRMVIFFTFSFIQLVVRSFASLT